MREKKRNKKILSLLIATLMIISMLPSSVFAAADDVMIEEYADMVTEEADVVDDVAEETAEVPDAVEQEVDEQKVEADLAGASEVVSATAEGILSGGKMTFDAVLDGVSVYAAVPASRAPRGSVMTADLVDVSDFADAISAKIYGKDVSALKGLELHFYNKKGKEITHINTSEVTITADAMDADSYALCRLNGRSVGVVKKVSAPEITFKEKKAYTYAIAGLVSDGVLRATAETGSNGEKSFSLDNIEVIAPKDAFADDVAMEASDVTSDKSAKEDELVGASGDEVIAAYEISFYNEEGVEQQPEKEVKVKITTALDMSKNYKLIHTADNGETNEVENAVFSENGVEFVADSFSTYTITGQSRNITVNYGYIENGAFVLFSSKSISSTSTSYPSSGLNQSNYHDSNTFLIYDFPGYTYKETRRGTFNGTQIWPMLRCEGTDYSYWSGWTYNWRYANYGSGDLSDLENTDDLENPSWTTFTNSNNTVYVIYEPKVITTGASGEGGGEGGGDEPEIPDLPATKSVEPNGDGTYDITLTVTGVEQQQEKITKASVIVLFDTSNSMNDNMAGNATNTNSERRVNIAKTAVNELAETLLNITDEETGEHLVQMALITFDTGSQIKKFSGKNYTTDYDTYSSAVSRIALAENGIGSTNWEAALLNANSLEVSSDAPTYIVFVSDGDPTNRVSRMNDNDSTVSSQSSNGRYTAPFMKYGLFGNGSAYQQVHYDAAKRVAQEIVNANKEFYTIGLSSQGSRMRDLAEDVTDADHYFPGNSPEELAEAFSEIASAVRENLGFSNVEINDGVTELSTIETDALTGRPDNFIYRKGTNSDPTQNPEWSGAPEADITADNHVVWDVTENATLEAGVTYSVTFTVWPSQESYDIIADINNGIIRNADGSIARTGTPAEAYAAQPEEIRRQIVINDQGEYTLKTNTNVGITYKYNGNDGSGTVTVVKEGSMPLDTSFFGIYKDWVNELPEDSRTAQVLTKQDEDGKYYLIDSSNEWILDGSGNKIEYDRSNPDSWKDKAVYYVDLIITKGDEDYTEVRLTSEEGDGKTAWTWDQMFIAPGVITHDKNATSGTITLRESGHDYTVREKPSESYYWELTAEIYHPMVINGERMVLQEVMEDAPDMEDKTFNGNYYKFDGKVYKVLGSADDVMISAINRRRSYLEVTKVVTGDESAPADALFEYTLTITDPEGEDLWFSAIDENGDTVMDLEVSGATAEEGDTGYWHAPSGKEFSFKIKAGWNVRFTNVLTGTEYEITESVDEMDEGFVFDSIEATAEINGEAQEYEPEIEDATITGEIEAPNTDYTITYTNEYLGVFYVYHSSDNTVERFPMAVDGVAVTSFNIYGRTADGTLYGGYYEDYEGKSEGFDAKDLEYDEDGKSSDEDGTAYSYQYIKDSGKAAWDYSKGYDVDGRDMEPHKDYVYFLKEVPVGYLRPYTHYTYWKANKKIGTLWTISDTDDLCYSKAGFLVKTKDKPAKILESMVITPQNNSSSTVTLTAAKVFKTKGVLDGYLGYADITDCIGNETLIQQYWETKDQIRVFGIKQRTLTFSQEDGVYKFTGITSTDTDYLAS